MGAGVSMTRLNHRCSYNRVDFDIRGVSSGTLRRNSEIERNAEHNGHTIELRAYDNKGRQIKYISFFSDCDDRWQIHNGGVRCSWRGRHSHSRSTWEGKWLNWDQDYESYYQDMDRREEEQRQREAREARERAAREARERAAREKAEREERERAERSAQERATDQAVAMLEQDTAERDEAAHIIAVRLQQQRQQAQMNLQRSVGWRSAESKAAQKDILDSVPIIGQGTIQDVSIVELCEMIGSSSLTDRDSALSAGFELVQQGSKLSFPFIRSFKEFLKVHFSSEDSSLMSILKANVHFLPLSIVDVLIEKMICCYIDDLKSNDDLLLFFAEIYKQKCAENSPWHQESYDEDFKRKLLSYIETYAMLHHLKATCKDAKETKSPQALLDVLKLIHSIKHAFPEDCISENLEVLAAACSLQNAIPVEAYDFFIQLIEENIMLCHEIPDLITKLIAAEKIEKQEAVLRSCLNSGIMSAPLLDYLEAAFKKEVNSSFTQSELLEWIGEFVQNGGQIPIGFLKPAVEMMNSSFPHETEFTYLLSLLEFCLISLDSTLVQDEIKKMQVQLPFLTALKDTRKTYGMKSNLLDLMSKLLNGEFLELDTELLQTVYSMVTNARKDDNISAASIFLQTAMQVNINLFSWLSLPLNVFNAENLPVTQLLVRLLMERLQHMKISGNYDHEVGPQFLNALTEVLDENSVYSDVDILSNSLTIFGLEIRKTKSRSILEPFCTNIKWLQKLLKNEVPVVREKAIYVISELVHNCVGESTLYFPYLTAALKNWPTEEAYSYAATALVAIVSNFTPAGSGDLLHNFLLNVEPSAFSCSYDLAECAYSVIEAWATKIECKFQEEDFKIICQLSTAKFGSSMVQKLFGFALGKGIEPKQTIIEEFKKISQSSKAYLPKCAISGFQDFLLCPGNNLKQKVELAEILSEQYSKEISNPDPSILAALLGAVGCGSSELVKLFIVAAYRFSVFSVLPETSVSMVWEIIFDPRVFMSVRKMSAQTLLHVVKKTPAILESNFMDKAIKLIDKVDLRIYGLFVLCYPTVLQLSTPVKKLLSVKLIKLISQRSKFTSIETMALTADEELSFQLSVCILKKMITNRQLSDCEVPELTSTKTFNWMTEWLNLHPEDAEAFVATENCRANKMIRTNPEDSSGHYLKVEVMLTKTKIAMTNRDYSKANSILDMATTYVKSHNLEDIEWLIDEQLASCHASDGNHRAAIKFWKKLRNSPTAMTETEIGYSIGKSLMADGRYDSAQRLFQELPSSQRFGYFWESKLCEVANVLFVTILSKTGSKVISKAQMKFLLTETKDFPPKETCGLVEFLIDRGEYYDLSVLATQPQEEWEVQFLKREVYGRSCPNDNELLEFDQAFLNLKMYLKSRNPDCWLSNLKTLLAELVEVQKRGYIQSVKACSTAMLLLRISSKTGRSILTESNSEEDLISLLQIEWLKSVLTYHQIQIPTYDDKLVEFWSVIKQSPLTDTNIAFLEDFLDYTFEINNLDEITSFFRFCQDNEIEADVIRSFVNPALLSRHEEKGVNLEQWKRDHERNKIQKYIGATWADFGESLDVLKTNLLGLYDRGQCSSVEIQHLLQSFSQCETKDSRTQDLIDILTVYNSYNLSKSTEWGGLNSLWMNSDSSEWKPRIRDVARERIKSANSTKLKASNELIEEFQVLNGNNLEILEIIKSLPTLIEMTIEAQKMTSKLQDVSETAINNWHESEISMWTNKVKHQSFLCDGAYLPELLAVMQRAMFLFKGYSLRKVGIMSICILLSNKEKGCLAKIATGEGKSGIVATLAAIKTLQGHTVDIVTSSPILAERDAAEWKPFFLLFGISVKENGGLQDKTGVPKSCYTMDVVYGDASTFEGDILRDEFSLLGTRGHRRFDVVIVDEVDSMFIDGSNHSTRLIDKMPQMDCLESVFTIIWHTVEIATSGITKIDGETFALERPRGKTNELIKAVFSILPSETKKSIKCSDENGLKLVVEKFASAMEVHEKQDDRFRNQVANTLRNRSLHQYLPSEIQNKLQNLSSLSDINTSSDVIDDYIRSKWKLSTSVNLRNVLEILLNVHIFIYDVEKDLLVRSSIYHSKSLETPDESDDTKQSFRFFLADNELYNMSKVANERQFIAAKTEQLVRSQIISSRCKRSDDQDKLYIPGHLFELFNTKIDEWIQSAIQAMFSLNLNRDYIIKPGGENDCETITPVDFRNTGVTQESCVWGEGLHQFLQIKHKLRITPEYLATNFISNLSFFQRYGQNIFGLTGTLGDENEVGLLKHLYSLNSVTVPTFKPKRLLELQPVVASESSEWLSSILNSTMWEIDSGRSVLIICKTIDDVKRIQEFLKLKFNPDKLKQLTFRIYSRSDDSGAEAAVSAELDPNTIVIATNLAGRGTNIKLSKHVVENGGLHVIISFLPTNLRVEEQAAGRAARSGEPGTSQLILNAESDISKYEDESSLKIESIKAEREASESERVEHIKTTLAKELYIEEKQFIKFCALQSSIKRSTKGKVQTTDHDHILNGVGERWAVQLEETKTRCDILDWDAIDTEFDNFFATLQQEYVQDKAIRNPSYYILKGNDLILAKDFKKGIHYFEKAMGLDTIFVQNAYYNRAYAIINDEEDGYKERAIQDLKKTADLIQTYAIPYLSSMHYMVEKKDLKNTKEQYGESEAQRIKAEENDSDFTKQIVNKMNFYYLQLRSITEASTKISETSGDLVAKFSEPKDYYAQNDQEVDYSDISDMEDNGFVAFMYVEKKPVPWYNILAVFVLGLVQMVVGACLCLVGAVNFGSGLIAEGIGDFITGITAAATGEFSWKEYWQNKGISIGVSLVLMGAGVILKAVAKLPKIAMLIAKVANTASKVGKTVAGVGVKLATQAKAFASYCYNSTKNFVSKLLTPFKGIGSKMTSSRVWTFSRDCFKAIKDKAIECGKKIRDMGKFVQDKLFGTQKLSAKTSKNFRLVGRVMTQQILEAGLMQALDLGILDPIGNEIEKQLRSTVAEFLQCQLAVGTNLGDKLSVLLKSCMGKKIDQQITVGMESFFEEKMCYGEKWGRQLADDIANQILDEINILETYKPKTGRGAILKFFANQVLSAIKQSITLAETIKKLSSMLPDLMTTLQLRMEEINQHVQEHDHQEECKGKSSPVNDNDVVTVTQTYVTSWSNTIAKRLRDFIISNILKPPIKTTATGALNKMTNKKQIGKLLEEAAVGNRAFLIAKAKNTIPFTKKGKQAPDVHPNTEGTVDTENNALDSNSSTSKVEISEGEDSNVTNNAESNKDSTPSKDESENKTENTTPKRDSSSSLVIDNKILDEAIDQYMETEKTLDTSSSLNLISSHLDEAIELYIEQEGQLRYKESYGSRKHSANEPIRLFQHNADAGEAVFSPIVSSPKSGELQIMEFEVHPESPDCGSSLVKSILVSKGKTNFTTSEVTNYNRKVTELGLRNKPRFVRSFTDSEIGRMDKISRNVLLCRRGNTSHL